jgi:hypothetical protein
MENKWESRKGPDILNQIKTIAAQLKAHPHFNKTLYWGKLISLTSFAQVLVQAIGFLSGILIIRLLPVEEYALYTLANTMLGTMTVLANGGISAGVMAQGGKVWKDREKLGIVLATGLDLRRKFAIFSLLISIPVLIYLMMQHGASWLTATMITLSLIPAFYAALSDSLLEIVPKLHQVITPLQKNQVGVGLGRLALNAGLLFFFPWTAFALIANGLPRIYGNYRLKQIAKPYATPRLKPDPKVRKEILNIVKRMMPGAFYYAFSGQITIWLISLLGESTSIAQLGALGRFSVLFSLFQVILNTLIVPRFARLENKKSLLTIRSMQSVGVIILLLIITIVLANALSDQLLWILGSEYSGLNNELLLSLTSAGIVVVNGLIFSLCSSKGWIIHPAIPIIQNILGIITGTLVFNISTLTGVLYMGILLASFSLSMNLIHGIYRLKKLKSN